MYVEYTGTALTAVLKEPVVADPETRCRGVEFSSLDSSVLGESVESMLPMFLALTAGFFIYIAASDLIPEIHHEKRKNYIIYETFLLLFGVVLIWLVTSSLPE